MCELIVNYMFGKRGVLVFLILIFVVANSGFVLAQADITGRIVKSGFEVDSLLLKVSVKEGDFVEKKIDVGSDQGGRFNLEVIGIDGIYLSESEVILQANQRKSVIVSFNASDVDAGVYVGYIEIASQKENARLPVIFEVESLDIFFDVNLDIPPKYSDVFQGDKIVVQLKIFDLAGVGTSTLEMEYYIKGTDGSNLVSESESVVVSGESQFAKTLSLPVEVKAGDYVFIAIARYKSSVGSSTDIFRISSIKKDAGSGDLGKLGGFNLGVVLIIAGAVVLVFFLILIFIFIYSVFSRNKLLSELKRHNASELKMQRQFLLAQEKIVRERKLIDEKEIKREFREKIDELKEKQISRVKEFEKFSDKGNMNEMRRKLNEWKRKGYNTLPLEYKMKGLTEKDMKKILKEWKVKYTEEYKK